MRPYGWIVAILVVLALAGTGVVLASDKHSGYDCARRGTDPEDVHEMRTAARRLRAILRAARLGFDRAWVGALRSELDWLGSTLGAVRDLDVLREHLRDELAALEDSTRRSASLQLS